MTEKEPVSEVTRFHATEALLLERAELHRLVDFFWQYLPYTRDEVYQMISTSLSVPDIHISDMSSEQIREVATTFHQKLSEYAPCQSCKHARLTGYGIYVCNSSIGAYWKQTDSITGKCTQYVPRDLPSKGSDKSGSEQKN